MRMGTMSKIGFISLGCPKNQIDTEIMLGHVATAGYEITPNAEEADIVIVNTCAFINDAKQESISEILELEYLKQNTGLKGIIVTGCLAQEFKDDILKDLECVDCVLGVGSIHSIVDAIKEVEAGNKFSEYGDINEVELGGDRIVTTGDSFAYLKISEGCNNHCTYCLIPSLRGKFRSRPMDDIIKEARELTEMGIPELVVIGQDTTAYGIDLYGKYELHTLLSRLARETDVKWLRVLYCYPDKITPELINEFKTNDKLVKYIDIPIQHINDRILKRMNRRGDGKMIKDVIAGLREVEGMTIRTTAIVGFPSETNEEFEELWSFVRETGFDKFGAFEYSPQEGTPAYSFENQIDDEIKKERFDLIMREQSYVSENLAKNAIGSVAEVIYEGYDPILEMHKGRDYKNAPEIDGMIFFKTIKKHEIGEFLRVEITDYDEEFFDLIGKEI